MNKWDERFNTDEYVYGKEPNHFLESVADKIPEGKILCLGEGEGRNAVFLAKKGYDVTAVDASEIGLKKAKKLADENSVSIHTTIKNLEHFKIHKNHWQGIVSIFCHLPKSFRSKLHHDCVTGLNSGGMFVMEAYSPDQLKYNTGGPKVPELLYDPQEIIKELTGLDFIHAKEVVREIYEGSLHKGSGSVIQILAQKK